MTLDYNSQQLITGTEILTAAGAISVLTRTTIIQIYTWSTLPVFTLSNPTLGLSGQKKTIVLYTSVACPVQINLPQGSFILPSGSVELVWNGIWYFIGTNRVPLFVTTQQGTKLVGTGYSGSAFFGNNVAISADGNTITAGAYNDAGGIGATWVFTRSGTVWTQQGTKLVGTGYTGGSQQQGQAISPDGNTLVIGAPSDAGSGASWVFTRTGTVWTQQGTKLVGTGYSGTPNQGYGGSSITSDSNTFVVGGYQDNSGLGSAWVFTRTGTVWTQQGTKLVGTGYTGNSYQSAVCISGNTIALGGASDSSGIGAVWIFTQTGTVWTQQGTKLVGTGYSGSAAFGSSVKLSSDSNTLAVGAPSDGGTGAVWIFTRSSGGTIWTQQGTNIIGTGYSSGSQGQSVSLTGDSNTLYSGSNGDNFSGAVFTFTRTGTVWTQQGTKLVGTGYTGSTQGFFTAISSNGNTLVESGQGDASNTGAIWIFN